MSEAEVVTALAVFWWWVIGGQGSPAWRARFRLARDDRGRMLVIPRPS